MIGGPLMEVGETSLMSSNSCSGFPEEHAILDPQQSAWRLFFLVEVADSGPEAIPAHCSTAFWFGVHLLFTYLTKFFSGKTPPFGFPVEPVL